MLLLFSASNAPRLADRLAAQRLPLLSRDSKDSESDALSFSRCVETIDSRFPFLRVIFISAAIFANLEEI